MQCAYFIVTVNVHGNSIKSISPSLSEARAVREDCMAVGPPTLKIDPTFFIKLWHFVEKNMRRIVSVSLPRLN